MFVKKIKYVDFNGNEREEDFYFNITKAEATEMELSTEGGLSEKIKRISNVQDGPEIIKLFKEVILCSYGEKSDDGKRFIKSKELREAFSQTEAFSELFMELATDADKAAEFIKSILPKESVSQLK